MYSSRTNSWKRLEEEDGGFEVGHVDGHGCLINGKLHWTSNDNIFTIDLSSERFGVLEPPDCVHLSECRGWSVQVVGKFLAVFCYIESRVGLWMMDRYGVKESWMRVNKEYPFDEFMPCFVPREGDMLLHRMVVDKPRMIRQTGLKASRDDVPVSVGLYTWPCKQGGRFPVVLTGTHRAWRKGSLHIRPEPIAVKFLPPIRTDEWKPGKVEEYAEMVHDVYVKNLPETQRPL